MKKCPQCGRDYNDDSMSFCLDDGAELLFGPASEPQTAILHDTARPVEAQTQAQILTTDQTTSSPVTNGNNFPDAKPRLDKRLITVLAMVIILAVAGYFGYRQFTTVDEKINSIAVLPFANASGDKDTDFLADGIAETLINNFTKIPELKVTARSTAFRFRGREGEPLEVGRELKVGSMLTGRLLQRGEQLSVQVDLISTSDGSQIWGSRYEGRTADLVNIQQRIATDVSSQLKLKLTGAQTEQVAKTYTQDPQAYQRYLRGRYLWNKRTDEDLRKALEEFQAAADADPSYALAFAGLGDTYVVLPEYAGMAVDETLPKARAFAEKALQIDPSLGEAHATLGLILHYEWRWNDADREYERAIQLNPNYPTVHHWFSNNLRERGDYVRALAEIRRAHELDPLSPIINVNVGILLALTGDLSGAKAQLDRTIELDRGWFNSYFWRGTIEVMEGNTAGAIPYLQKSVELNRALRPVGMLGHSLAATGRRDEALKLLRELEERYANKVGAASNIASIYIGLGEKEKAYEWLDKGFAERDVEIARVTWAPQFNPLRNDERFVNFRKKVRPE